MFKVNPPLRTPADVAAIKAGLADGTIDAIATDHAPHPPEDKERPLDQAPPGMLGLETALGVALARARHAARRRASPRCRGSRRRSPASPTATAARSSPAAPANLTVFDPDATWQVRPAALASRSRNTPYVGRTLRGRVRHTIFGGAAVVVDGMAQTIALHESCKLRRMIRSIPTTSASRRLLVLADGSVFEGEAIGADAPAGSQPARSCSTRRCPATRRSSPTRATPGRSSRSPTRTSATTASTPPTSSPAGRSAGASIVRDLARRHSNHRAEGDLDAMLARYGIPGIAGIDTRRLTRLIRDTGAMPGAFGTADEADAARAAAAPSRAPTASTSSPRSPRPSRTPSAASGPFRIVAYDFGIKRTILRHLAGLGTVEVVPASTPAADVLARQPDGVFLSNGPGDPARCRTPSTRSPSCSARCRCSGSASATSCSAGRSARARSSCRSATTAATTRCRT